ncbi:MAG TPA: ferritin family protein [Planctomycetaceae bacterium]|nr:ferritin family protein [Planctomycetaceae bacterium]
MRRFKDLSSPEVLALAISLEEEDARIYQEYARVLRNDFPVLAAKLDEMRLEEDGHRHRLIELFERKYGKEIPLIRREDVRGFVKRRSPHSLAPLGPAEIRKRIGLMEEETERFYAQATRHVTDADLRQLLGDLAEEERRHEAIATAMAPENQSLNEREAESTASRRLFIMQVVQPGLAGLMDGSVSTLAPLFAAAFATRHSEGGTWETFLVGLAAAVGAGISMGFAEALSDDGSLTGRGKPLLRGIACGGMTFLGGVGHALPYLIPDFWTATSIATIVVGIELALISWIRNHYMDTPFLYAFFQVVVGGVLVFITGILIGSS